MHLTLLSIDDDGLPMSYGPMPTTNVEYYVLSTLEHEDMCFDDGTPVDRQGCQVYLRPLGEPSYGLEPPFRMAVCIAKKSQPGVVCRTSLVVLCEEGD